MLVELGGLLMLAVIRVVSVIRVMWVISFSKDCSVIRVVNVLGLFGFYY